MAPGNAKQRALGALVAGATFALCLAGAAPAGAAGVVSLGKGFPVALNESDHVLVGNLVHEEVEGKLEESLEGPYSIWAEDKSTTLTPLNGPEKHEAKEEPKHELLVANINAAGDVGGSSTVSYTDEGKERVVFRAVWWGPEGKAHQVPVLQETFTNKEGETFHDPALGAGIDNAGDVAGIGAFQSETGAYLEGRGYFAAGGTGPVVAGEAARPAGGTSTIDYINGSGEMLGAVTGPEEGGVTPQPTFYLWPNAGASGTELTFDTPYFLADDGSVLGIRGGTVYLRTPDGSETAVNGIEQAFRVNSQHEVVGSIKVAGAEHAAAWQNGAVTDLNSQLPKGSGWVLERAVAINDSGDIAGVGSHEGKEEAFLLEAGATSATELSCAPSATKGVASCTAKVSVATGEKPPRTPTGSVTFTARAGSPPPGWPNARSPTPGPRRAAGM